MSIESTPAAAAANARPAELHESVARQLAALELRRDRPLIVSDADEVLFAFMAGFERYLLSRELYFDWRSFALTGNIRRRDDDQPLAADQVPALLKDFFDTSTELLEPVPGAAAALAALAPRAQIVVLSNVPLAQRAARRRALASHGMDYPLIANVGGKGAAVRQMAARVAAPVFFIDDIPHQHRSVRQAAAATFCLHFVADSRLAALLGTVEGCDHCATDWPSLQAVIAAELQRHGY